MKGNVRTERMNDISWNDAYEQYYHPLYCHVIKYVRHTEDAEDITQASFLRVWKQVHCNKDIQSLKDYLYRTAYHLAIDCVHQRHHVNLEDIGERPLEELAAVPDFSEELADDEERSQLLEKAAAAWATLKPSAKEALSICYDGFTHAPCSQPLEVQTKQVGYRAYHGMKKIRKK